MKRRFLVAKLCHKRNYADFILEVDFKVNLKFSSDVQIRSHCFDEKKPLEANGKKSTIPASRVHGYQVEIDPCERAWTGGIYDEGRRGWLNDLMKNDAARKAFKKNEGNTFRIECRSDSLTPSGFIALQVHAVGKEEDLRSVRFRNLRLKELK